MSVYKVIGIRNHKLQRILCLQTYHTLYITHEHLINLVQIRTRESYLIAHTVVTKLSISYLRLITLHIEHRQEVGSCFLSGGTIVVGKGDISIAFLYIRYREHNLVDILADDSSLVLHCTAISRKIHSRNDIHVLTADEHFVTHLHLSLHRRSRSQRSRIFHCKLALRNSLTLGIDKCYLASTRLIRNLYRETRVRESFRDFTFFLSQQSLGDSVQSFSCDNYLATHTALCWHKTLYNRSTGYRLVHRQFIARNEKACCK